MNKITLRMRGIAGGILVSLAACTPKHTPAPVTFMVADPGHFHASLVLKSQYDGVTPNVFVYAPEGPELLDFEKRVNGYLTGGNGQAGWKLEVVRDSGFFNKMLSEKPGNVVVLAGNNGKKTEYIRKAVERGLTVFSDKPMAINPEGFRLLEEAFRIAGEKDVLLYDIMTERFEITSILQKEFSQVPQIFGTLLEGTAENPAVTKESVHHFFKYVSGAKLTRPPWFFDVLQQGEGIADVTTHLVDLVQWACFPDQIIDYHKDIQLIAAKHWPTVMQMDEFREVTGLTSCPEYLLPVMTADSTLRIFSNGEISYRLKGVHARVSVIWKYRAPEGGGDTHYSVMRGSKARLEIRQGPEQGFKPELYILPESTDPDFSKLLTSAIVRLSERYPGIGFTISGEAYKITVPKELRTTHEEHFVEVTRRFLEYYRQGALPDWEVPNMLAKYWLTTSAQKLANESD